MRRTLGLLLAGLTLTASGCGPTGPQRLAVDGKVTLGGKPLDRGNIELSSASSGAQCASGAVIRAGSFAIPREHGLLPGKYLVRVYSADPNVTELTGPPGSQGVPVPKDLVPAKYNAESTLTVEVKQGMGSLDIRLD